MTTPTASSRHFLERVLEHAPDLICALDAAGTFRHVGAARHVLGYDGPDLVGQSFGAVLHPDDRAAALARCLAAFEQAEPLTFESRCLSRTGQEVVVAWAVSRPPAEALLLCIGRDVTAQRQAVREARAEAELHRALMKNGFDMVTLLDEQGVYTYAGGANMQPHSLGYRPEERVGRSVFGFIHPDDQAYARHHLDLLRTQPVVKVSDFRIRAADGQYRWVESIVSNQLLNPAIRAYAVSSRDITERKNREAAAARSEQRFRLVFDHDAALSFFQDTTGLVLDANPAFLAFFQKQRDEVINRPLADVLPPGARPLFAHKLGEAAAGQPVRYAARLPEADGRVRTLQVTQNPLEVDGTVIGVHVTAQDTTDIATAQHLIKRQARQLDNILESLTDSFIALDRDYYLTYINREAESTLGLIRAESLGKNLWDLFPEHIDGLYHQQYRQALETGHSVHFEAHFDRSDRWVEVRAYPSEDGLSIYFADITERIAAERQLKLLALVAKDTDNGVIITNAAGRMEWVNEGFTRHTGYTLAEAVGRGPGELLQGAETDPAAVERFRERLREQVPFAVTILNYTKAGKKLWHAIEVTPIFDDAGRLTQYVAIQQDITYRKEIEASQAKMTRDLYRHNRDLQQFTYVISHNLRAPLANALGLGTLLTKLDKDAESFDQTVAMLRKSVGQADQVLKDLNLVLSIRDKQDVVVREPVALADVCAQVIEDLEETWRRCGAEVHLELEGPLLVPGVRAYFYSIFHNLLSNAIKYRAAGRRLVVNVHCLRTDSGVTVISFADNGSGFDLFKAGSDVFQLYKRFHTNQRGRGIGLFLVKTHVEALGGKIEVFSNVDAGTRFLIHLDPH